MAAAAADNLLWFKRYLYSRSISFHIYVDGANKKSSSRAVLHRRGFVSTFSPSSQRQGCRIGADTWSAFKRFFLFFSLFLSKPASIAAKSRKCYTRGITAFVEETHLWWHNLGEMAATLPGPACLRDDILSSSISFLIIFLLVFNPSAPRPPTTAPPPSKIPSAIHPSIYFCTPLIHLWFLDGANNCSQPEMQRQRSGRYIQSMNVSSYLY